MTSTSFYFRSLPCDQVDLIIHWAVITPPFVPAGFLCRHFRALKPSSERMKVANKCFKSGVFQKHKGLKWVNTLKDVLMKLLIVMWLEYKTCRNSTLHCDKEVFLAGIWPKQLYRSITFNNHVILFSLPVEPFCLASYPSAFHSVMFNPVEPRLLATANSKEGVGLWDIRKPRRLDFFFPAFFLLTHFSR